MEFIPLKDSRMMQKCCKTCIHKNNDPSHLAICAVCVDKNKYEVNPDAFYDPELVESGHVWITNSKIPDHYNYQYKGMKIDPYRGGDIYGITCPALFHAWKKIIRAGKDVKSYKQDITEARNALNRKLEMLEEDENL